MDDDRPAPPVIREMRWWDIPPVLALEHALFPEDAWSPGMFWSELADTRHPAAGRRYLVAEEPDGRITGYAGLFSTGPDADIQTIATARDRWGSGLGPALLQELMDEAARRGCERVLLEVRTDNLRAQRLYERFGFDPIGVRRNYYAEAGMDALVMQATTVNRAAPAARTRTDTENRSHG